ncbi:hypothetical protein EG68_08550, partial [Paragonimus skrjabini miyazakii]
IIYDELYEDSIIDLQSILDELKTNLTQVVHEVVYGAQSHEMCNLTFTVRTFYPSAACLLIADGARAIISLTSCPVARSIGMITNRFHILHVALPKSLCDDVTNSEEQVFDTLWQQPRPEWVVSTLYNLIKMEHIPRAFLFSDSTSGLPELLLQRSSYLALNDELNGPVFAANLYQVNRTPFPSRYSGNSGMMPLDEVLNQLERTTDYDDNVPTINHGFLFTNEPHIEAELIKVNLYTSEIVQCFV